MKQGFLNLETIETWIVYVCHSEGEWARQLGMVVGGRCISLCQEWQRCWIFDTQQFPVCIKNGPPLKGHPANLTQL